MESRRAQLEARALANRRPRTPGEMRGDRNHSPTHGDDLARGSAVSRRSDDDMTEGDSYLSPVRSKWRQPPPADLTRPKSTARERLREARDRDGSLNDLQEPSLERPSISSSTHRSSRRRPQYADPNQQLDEDSALHRLADLQHQPPRTRKAPSLVEAWDSNQGFRDENYQEASSIGLAELGTLTQKRHEALQAEEQNLIQHRTVAQSHQDWVEDLTEILDLNHQEQAHLDAEIEELLHGRSRSKIMKGVLVTLMQRNLKMAMVTWKDQTGFGGGALIQEQTIKELERQLAEAMAAHQKVEKEYETSMANYSANALKNANASTYKLILNVFGKLMGDYSRTYFATWKKKSDEYAEYQKRWGRFFKRALNIKMAAGFQAWVTFYRFTQLPPEEALAHVRAQMAKYKAEMEAQKASEQEAIAKLQRELMEAEEGSCRRLLIRVVSRLLNMKAWYGFKRWLSRVALYKHQRKLVGGFISRFENMNFSKGWNSWRAYARAHQENEINAGANAIRDDIRLKEQQLEDTIAQLRALEPDVEQMRDSIKLQHEASKRVAAAMPDVAKKLAELANVKYRPPPQPAPVTPAAVHKSRRGGPGPSMPSRGGGPAYGSPGPKPRSRSRDPTVSSMNRSRDFPAPIQTQSCGSPAKRMTPKESDGMLLTFLRHAHEADTLEEVFMADLRARVPNFDKYQRKMRTLAENGDRRYAAAVEAFELLGDARDLWENIDLIQGPDDVFSHDPYLR